MPAKKSRIERGKDAIMEMVKQEFPEMIEPEVMLTHGTNRNCTLRYILVMSDANVIVFEEFLRKVTDYFAPYQCIVGRNRTVSYVLCESIYRNDTTISEVDPSVPYIVAEFEVKYHKTHVPFPTMEFVIDPNQRLILQLNSRIAKIEEDNKKLTTRFKEVKTNNNRLIKKNNMLIGKTKNYMANIKKVINKIYEACSTKENCPTCWEDICVEKLYVTGCGHFICTDCKDKLSKPECPMCRESLNTAIVV